ncbi:MAG TPA: hypothetical protein VK880_02635, partial [Anaerolineales bacterium]|nr:hypothetical protein [Anaerolineales bacterium]
MTKLKQAGLILILMMMLTACTLSSTSTVIPPATESPLPVSIPTAEHLPFEGMWVSEGDAPEIIVFTGDSMYKVESDLAGADQTYSREQFAKVVLYDLENNH